MFLLNICIHDDELGFGNDIVFKGGTSTHSILFIDEVHDFIEYTSDMTTAPDATELYQL